jgi:hypothetical protein
MRRGNKIMKALRNITLGLFAGLLCASAFAQSGGTSLLENSRQLRVSPSGERPRSSMYSYLASDEGRAWMQVSGNPKSKALNQRFGEPSPAAVAHAQVRLRQMSSQPRPTGAPSAAQAGPCKTAPGVRFNLEPRVNAVLQNEPTADFILNGAGSGSDLVVQTANDARGNLPPGSAWDGSLSGYYVHTSSSVSTTMDCSVQFEGGLPSFNNTLGLGATSVVADAVHGAFFAADNRFLDGGAIFRAAAADFLNPAKCPNGTHSEAQAESCWMQTPPVQIASTFQEGIYPILAVDERTSGTGAGDVYVVGEGPSVFIVACTNLLKCSSMLTIDTDDNYNNPFVQVRPDGLITISYMQSISGQSFYNQTINFVTCTPGGAPNPPVCGKPTTVATVTALLLAGAEPQGTAAMGFSYTQHANRQESNGNFTTFLVYDDCTNLYTAPPPPNDPLTYCMATRVHMTFSTDNGQTWSTPVSVDNQDGFHFFPTITNDASTATVTIAHYSTEGDYFQHDIRVVLNQVLPGTTTPGSSKPVTTFTSNTNFAMGAAGFDLSMGAVARGTGVAGQSHLYLSFDSISVNGIYNGEPVPDGNNQIELITY